MSDCLRLHWLQPIRILCPWDSLGKNTGVGCHFLLQGIFPIQGSNPGLLHPSPGDLPNPGIKPRSFALQVDSLPSESPGKLLMWWWNASAYVTPCREHITRYIQNIESSGRAWTEENESMECVHWVWGHQRGGIQLDDLKESPSW